MEVACKVAEAEACQIRECPLERLAGYLAVAKAQEHIPAGALTHTAFGRATQRIAVPVHHRPYAQRVRPTQQVRPRDGSLAQVPASLLHAFRT